MTRRDAVEPLPDARGQFRQQRVDPLRCGLLEQLEHQLPGRGQAIQLGQRIGLLVEEGAAQDVAVVIVR